MASHIWTQQQVEKATAFFQSIQGAMIDSFREIDSSADISRESWDRADGGGGSMACLRGPVVEKAGANFSHVYGSHYPNTESEYAGKKFMATGVSTITHMYNPHAPIGHMNVRLIQVGGEKCWFGGGADLTPFLEYSEDTEEFHAALKSACQEMGQGYYEKFSKWCDEYFYIKHRKEVRGVGGVFFDYLEGDFEHLFPFVQAVANAYVEVFPKIILRRSKEPFTEKQKDEQLFWRGRYAEFNLAYDRGTRFGLLTGGNIKAIFVSLPPVVKW